MNHSKDSSIERRKFVVEAEILCMSRYNAFFELVQNPGWLALHILVLFYNIKNWGSRT